MNYFYRVNHTERRPAATGLFLNFKNRKNMEMKLVYLDELLQITDCTTRYHEKHGMQVVALIDDDGDECLYEELKNVYPFMGVRFEVTLRKYPEIDKYELTGIYL